MDPQNAPPMAPSAMPSPSSGAAVPAATSNGFDVTKFQTERRIHVVGGSYFGRDDEMYLLAHPGDLKPENIQGLRQRLAESFTHREPQWFSTAGRVNLVSSLSELFPLSADAEGAKFAETIKDYVKKMAKGNDPASEEQADKEAHPFAAKIQRMLEDKPLKQDENETLKNGIGLYLLLDKALEGMTPPGLAAQAGGLVNQAHSADMLFAKLQPVSNIDGNALKKAAREGGLAGAGRALGLQEAYVQDVIKLVSHLPEHKFSSNAIENWKIGREQPGMAHAGIHEKIMAGVAPRIEQKIRQLQGFFHNRTEVDSQIARHEGIIADGLRLLPPAVTEAFFRKGGSVSFSLQPTLNGRGLHGLNIRSHEHTDDVVGFNHVAVAAGQGADSMLRTLVHEVTHTIHPNYLSETDIARTDALAVSDRQRLTQLNETMQQWRLAKTPEEKAAIEQKVETQFAVEGRPWSKMRGAADFNTLAIMVDEAWRNLNSESPKLILSGYSEPEKRMAEVNSRYAELRFVRYREMPDALKFVVPGLTEAYDQVYLPHVERAVSDMRIRQMPKTTVASAQQSSIVVPNAHTQHVRPAMTTSTAANPESEGVPSNSILTANMAVNPTVRPAPQTSQSLQ